MQHARKMVLVPEDSINKISRNSQLDTKSDDEVLQNSILKTVQTPGTNLTRLDTEMSEILNSNDSDAYAKWKKYQQTLQRYLFFRDNVKKSDDVSPNSEVTNGIDDETIAASVPSTWRRKAVGLIQFLKRPEVAPRISWDNRGTVTIDGNILDDSNIVDLVNDVARSRKNVKASGREEFARFLYESGIPLEFMGNTGLYKLGQKLAQINISSSTPNAQRIQSRENLFTSTPVQKSQYESFLSADDTVIEENHSHGKKSKKNKTKSLNSSRNQSGGGWLTLSM